MFPRHKCKYCGKHQFWIKLVQFSLLNFWTKLVQFFIAYIYLVFHVRNQTFYFKVSCIKRVPLLHKPKISCRKTLCLWKLCLKVQTDLIDNPCSPFFFRFSDHKISPELPVKKKLLGINFNCLLSGNYGSAVLSDFVFWLKKGGDSWSQVVSHRLQGKDDDHQSHRYKRTDCQSCQYDQNSIKCQGVSANRWTDRYVQPAQR